MKTYSQVMAICCAAVGTQDELHDQQLTSLEFRRTMNRGDILYGQSLELTWSICYKPRIQDYVVNWINNTKEN